LENSVAKTNYQFEKRRKEIAKKKKNEEKRERKLAKKNPQVGEDQDFTAGEEETVQPGLSGSLLMQDGAAENVPRDPGSPEERVESSSPNPSL